jgi:hypothetical protein
MNALRKILVQESEKRNLSVGRKATYNPPELFNLYDMKTYIMMGFWATSKPEAYCRECLSKDILSQKPVLDYDNNRPILGRDAYFHDLHCAVCGKSLMTKKDQNNRNKGDRK